VEKISGKLTDNFNPSNNILSLSDSTYNSDSVAAIGVAAHEVGHACQHNDGYFMMKLRSFLVPAVNIGSTLAFPLAILGVFIEWFSATMFGPILIVMGIILYSLSFVFSFITLPTELNASRRAKQMLYEYGFVTKQEQKQVGSVLYAAALTYFASLIVSFLYLLRFIVIIASLRRKD
jgi:Zn-dependent membrane protease YugP